MAPKRQASFDPTSFLAKVGEGRSIVSYRKDQIVFSQGDPADTVFYIQKGKVKVSLVSEQGKEAIVAIVGTNEFFGEGCLAGQSQRIATVTAIPGSHITQFEKTAIVQVIHEEPAFSEVFIAYFVVGPSASKPTSLTSCLIQARNALHDCCCCWQTSARKESQSR